VLKVVALVQMVGESVPVLEDEGHLVVESVRDTEMVGENVVLLVSKAVVLAQEVGKRDPLMEEEGHLVVEPVRDSEVVGQKLLETVVVKETDADVEEDERTEEKNTSSSNRNIIEYCGLIGGYPSGTRDRILLKSALTPTRPAYPIRSDTQQKPV